VVHAPNFIVASPAHGLESARQEGPGSPSNTFGGILHSCYWPLLENAKSASISTLTLAMPEKY